jgi:chemotaxis protein CheX
MTPTQITTKAAPEAKTVPDSMVRDIIDSTQEVFETMVFIDAVPGTPHPSMPGEPRAEVVATIALTGPSNAVVTIYGSTIMAKTIAASMLGMAAEEINDEYADAIGELGNMIAGSFRNRMTAAGGTWAISVPTVTVGQRIFTHYPEDVGRVVCPFEFSGNQLSVELVLRT